MNRLKSSHLYKKLCSVEKAAMTVISGELTIFNQYFQTINNQDFESPKNLHQYLKCLWIANIKVIMIKLL
ncbi:hypothetical protein SAMN06296008_1141 [Polynucleobacter kasalickyi]|uniref:Uncharacterized protein n=1 Tax=Polynucleobacter kasalickyi TaxID=1938817 RepID=A0A1W2BLC3_9BURK|nr:hypothetical protein SAMN06296008_1141 [Polynucleobacter kasalickyi]